MWVNNVTKAMHQGHNQILGLWGENCAAEFLERNGFNILFRNVRTQEGEIDLVAGRGDLTVFVEVKTRADNQSGYPEEAISEVKMEHMLDSAEQFLQDHPEYDGNWRIDVIAVTGRIGQSTPQIEWFEDAA
jgi:putative endonuclease